MRTKVKVYWDEIGPELLKALKAIRLALPLDIADSKLHAAAINARSVILKAQGGGKV